MELPDEVRARIRSEEEYRYRVFSDLNKPAKLSIWDRINSPIAIWAFGSLVLSIIPFLFSQYSNSLKVATEARALSYGIQVRLTPVEQLLPEVIKAGTIDDASRYRISNSFTGKMEQPPDAFGKIGVPGLLFRYAAVSGAPEAAKAAQEYLNLMVPLEREGIYSRGAGHSEAKLTQSGRELLKRFSKLVGETRQIVSRSTE